MRAEADNIRKRQPLSEMCKILALEFFILTSWSVTRLAPLAGAPLYHLPPVKAPTSSKKKSSKHCFLCGRKTGLASSYECRYKQPSSVFTWAHSHTLLNSSSYCSLHLLWWCVFLVFHVETCFCLVFKLILEFSYTSPVGFYLPRAVCSGWCNSQ